MVERYSTKGRNVVSELAAEMKASISTLAGVRLWGDTRESWLSKAAAAAGISYRATKCIFYGEDREPRASTVEKIRRAVEARKAEEANARAETRDLYERLAFLEQRLAQIDYAFYCEDFESLRAATSSDRRGSD